MKEHRHLYKGINGDLIDDIYDLLYTKSLTNDIRVNLRTNSELKSAAFNEAYDCFELEFHQYEQGRYYKHSTEGLILATGYTYQLPCFVEGISSRIKWDERGRFDVNRNYNKESIEKFADGNRAPLDSLSFIVEFSKSLGIPEPMLPTYMEEITSTLYGSAYKHAREGPSAADLTRADYQEVERAMMEGHPSWRITGVSVSMRSITGPTHPKRARPFR